MIDRKSAVVTIAESTHLVVSGCGLTMSLRREFCRRLSLPNPHYVEAQKFGRWVGNIPEALHYYEETSAGALVTPRGALSMVLAMVRSRGIEYSYRDETLLLPPLALDARMTLSDAQARAVEQALATPKGQLVAPPGSGKTIMALQIIGRRQQPTLWLTHTKELAGQAQERASQFLGVDPAEIGMVGSGSRTMGEHLTIGMVQTLARGVPQELLQGIGHVVVDECHHTPAEMTAKVISQFPARYLLGLSATPYRRDGLDAAITFHLGPISAELTKPELAERLVQPQIFKRDTGISPPELSFAEMVSWLCANPRRLALIVGDVTRAARGGRKALALTDRVEHAEALADAIRRQGVAVALLHGGISQGERDQVRSRMDAGRLSVVVATGQLIGEGWDCPRLDTLFLATPLSYHGRLTQYLGRVRRSAPGKREATVIDYCDNHPMLWASWRKRRTAYKGAGYRVQWAPARAA